MLKSITLENFKCFQKQTIELSNVTLLSGLNGMGKSSVIQALLVLRQSFKNTNRVDGFNLIFNEKLTKIGNIKDVLYENSKEERIIISVIDDNYECGNLSFTYNIESNKTRCFKNEIEIDNPYMAKFDSSLFRPEPRDFKYLQAERVGSRLSFPKTNFQSVSLPELSLEDSGTLGINGEYTAQFLSLYGEEIECPKEMKHPDSNSQLLNRQVEAWLNVISPNVRLHITDHEDMDVMELKYSYGGIEGQVESRAYRTTNVGFGITYVLPVITALLSTEKDGLVILENPEAHLHPQGQRYMGELIACAARAGIQVIVETHSDHVLNGIRLAVKKGILEPEQTRFHYFGRNNKGEIEVTTPKIDKDGNIDNWVDGFFDEWEKMAFALF